jgi:short-subunit dehydrogenase
VASGQELQPLLGKSALIVGASGGIGSAAAILLAKAGAQVILSGRDTEKLESLASQIEFAAGIEAPVLAADLTDADQVNQLVQQAAAQYGGEKLDMVINAAGIGAIKSIENLTPQDFQTLLAVNLYGAMLLSQAAVRVMAPRKAGHILHVIGILGKAPMANATAYCASKYGLSGFLAALRAEVARRYSLKVTGLYLGGSIRRFTIIPPSR